MITIKLRFTAQLKDIVGKGMDTVSVNEKEKLQDVLKNLVNNYGADFGNILFDENGAYRHSNLIVINQNQVDYKENISITDGMEITLMSPISGG
jgi:molybdopterin converting factor small subunit